MFGTSDIQMLLMHCSVTKQFRRLVGVDKMVSTRSVTLWLFSSLSCLVASSLEVHLPANVRAVRPVSLVGRKTAEGEIESATIKEGQSDAGKVKNSSVSFQMNGLISTVIEISSHCELNNSCIKKRDDILLVLAINIKYQYFIHIFGKGFCISKCTAILATKIPTIFHGN